MVVVRELMLSLLLLLLLMSRLLLTSRTERRRTHTARARRGLAVGLTVLRVAVTVTLLGAAILPIGAVSLDVFGQVIRAHEPLVADGASEPLLPGVCSQVSLELVRPGEPLAAEQPVADKGTLSRVPPEMGFQVGGLAVDLAAAGDVTAVDVSLPEMLPRGS